MLYLGKRKESALPPLFSKTRTGHQFLVWNHDHLNAQHEMKVKTLIRFTITLSKTDGSN